MSDKAAPCPLDQITAGSTPQHRTGSGFRLHLYTTWIGFVYVALVIGRLCHRIVGRRGAIAIRGGATLDMRCVGYEAGLLSAQRNRAYAADDGLLP